MVGLNWLAMLPALPRLIVYAAGEFSMFLAPVLAAIPGVGYWLTVGRHDAANGFGAGYVSTTIPAPRVAALEPPLGTEWPRSTGYLALPQLATGGDGVIRVRASMSRVYVKLCEAGQRECPGLRHALIERGDRFDFRGVAVGSYEVRYCPSIGPARAVDRSRSRFPTTTRTPRS